MSPTSLNSGWRTARRIIDNILHKYPKLPKTLPREGSLPLQIGSKISVKEYNTFLNRNENTGYKFNWERGEVFIVEMAKAVHEAAISYIEDCFKEPNNGVKVGPIKVLSQPLHYKPTGHGEQFAPDVAVCGRVPNVVKPLIPHPGPPPSDVDGNPHARIISEVANTQTVANLNTKCEAWMHETYVRCVLGIKLFPKRTIGGVVHQAMLARLWTRRPTGTSVLSTNATLAAAGVHVTEWDFGTIQHNNNTPTPTGCTTLNNAAFRILIPTIDAFYDSPTAAVLPVTVVGANFTIDLFELQQVVMEEN
ncbi:hypothetical protein C1646_774277 [Rhizophagus diaphanus]|nr:hypothetical protein C1646_774277 [Rhizophagus diaphanus] [Rhizophagus sp. MUCL 43196]